MPYITVKDAATLAGVSKRTLHRWIAAGKIPARHANKRDMTVLAEDVTHYVAQLPQKLPSEAQETAARFDAMALQIAALEARLDALEQEIAGRATARQALAPSLWQEPLETEAQSVSKTKIPAGLPEGSMIAAHFAKKIGKPARTITGHLADPAHPVTGFQRGRTWWMTPEQQASAAAYYRGG